VNDTTWKNISIALGVICALLLGVAGAIVVIGSKGDSPSASGDPLATNVSVASPSSGSTVTVGPDTTPGPDSSASSVATATTVPTASGPGTPTTITFNDLGLDAAKDENGTLRTFSFVSDGPGEVTYGVTKVSKGGTVKMCVKVDAGGYYCKISKAGTPLTFPAGKADAGRSTWTIYLVGYGTTTPTVDVSITWPTVNPSITLTHGRLQGSSSPGISESFNGFTATVKPRSAGALTAQAQWTTITTDIDMTLSDVTTPPSTTVDHRTYKSVTFINPTYSFNVDPAKTYQIKLRDQSADSMRPDLTAQITWP
jgi:hypothetical protein